MICVHCNATLSDYPRKLRCATCLRWNIGIPFEEDEETVLLSDARLSAVDRVSVGIFDRVFGGGIVKTSVNLVGGLPGAGKTTFFLQLADIFAVTFPDREVLYIANEQDASEIKITAHRIGVTRLNQIRMVKAMGGLKSDMGELLLKWKPCVFILDSLTKLVGEDMTLAVTVAERLKGYSVELNAPSLIVNQVNKEGDHSGLQKLQHAVDATFMLQNDPEVPEDRSRFLYSLKNRFGMCQGLELEMTAEDDEYPGKLVDAL